MAKIAQPSLELAGQEETKMKEPTESSVLFIGEVKSKQTTEIVVESTENQNTNDDEDFVTEPFPFKKHSVEKGFVFCFRPNAQQKAVGRASAITNKSERLVYIVDYVIELKGDDDDVYRCTKIISNAQTSFPGRIYLTKHQLNSHGVMQLSGLDLLTQSTIYGQQLQSNKLDENDLDPQELQLKLLREEKLNLYFSIQQIVYYVSEIPNVDTIVCKLSKKNDLDKLKNEIAYPPEVVLNRDEINELQQNGHAFNGTGCMLKFDQDIYSFYASFYFSRTHTPSWALFDVLKYYSIKEFEQCGSGSTALNATEPTSLCFSSFVLVEANGGTQRFAESQTSFYKSGYMFTGMASLLILTFYVYRNAVGPIKWHVSLSYCDNIDQRIPKKVNNMTFFIQAMTLFAYSLGVWSIVMYPVGQGISDPFGVLALPISVVFVLELDDWVFYVVQIGYAAYIQSSFGVEITDDALAAFGRRSKKEVQNFIAVQGFACFLTVTIAYLGSNEMEKSSDVFDVFSRLIEVVMGFTWFLYIGLIWIYDFESRFRMPIGIKLVAGVIVTGILITWVSMIENGSIEMQIQISVDQTGF
eukprot:204612_1